MTKRSDKAWERFAQLDPYFAVKSERRYRAENMTSELREQFYAEGREHAAMVLRTVESQFGPLRRDRVLDFGCGLGRILFPFAAEFTEAVGVDASPTMLRHARTEAETRGIHNIEFVESDDHLTTITKQFSLVHSHITLQHLPQRRGRTLMKALFRLVAPGGTAVLHFPIASSKPAWHRAAKAVALYVPAANSLFNMARRRPIAEPATYMTCYNLSWVVTAASRFARYYMLPTDHGGYRGVIFFATTAL